MDTSNELIQLFSQYTVEQIESSNGQLLITAFGSRRYDRLIEDSAFKKLYTVIVEMKLELEFIQERHKNDADGQAKECLYLIRQKTDAREEEIEVLLGLIKKNLYPAWNDALKKLFEKKSSVITSWKDYFISYTNRDAPQTNGLYATLIRQVFLKMPHEDIQVQENFLPKIVVKFFESNDLVGFFDCESIKSGEEIEDEVREYCRNVFAFVQVIEHKTFSKPRDKRNWCFEEYNEFTSSEELEDICEGAFAGRHHFITIEKKLEDMKPINFYPNFQDWYNHVERVKYIWIHRSDNQIVRREVKKMGDQIFITRNDVISSILRD